MIQAEAFLGADFTLQQDGACRLNPEMARTIANQVKNLLEQQNRH